MNKLKPIFLLVVVLVAGCSMFSSKEPFQNYAPRHDCVSCKAPGKWGFMKREIHRNGEFANYAAFFTREISSSGIEKAGLCLGTALDTLRSGYTHFHILEHQKWGDWYNVKNPVRINIGSYGTGTITGGGTERSNLDWDFMQAQSSLNWTSARHYYKTGTPDCIRSLNTNFKLCSTRYQFDVQDCPYEGDELRKKTEEQKGSLACVMKRNPRLLLEKAYSGEGDCSFVSDGWISAKEVVKIYENIFEMDK